MSGNRHPLLHKSVAYGPAFIRVVAVAFISAVDSISAVVGTIDDVLLFTSVIATLLSARLLTIILVLFCWVFCMEFLLLLVSLMLSASLLWQDS
jgi:hypothetical protein